MSPSSGRELPWLPWLRGLFLVAVVVFAWLGLRGRFGEVADAMGDLSPAAPVGALLLVVVGLLATAGLWLRCVAGLGTPLPALLGAATFFVGQLGKYVPGSVWSLGAQADLARRHEVPVRHTVTAGLVFLGYHLTTGAALGSAVVLAGGLDAPWPLWVTVLVLVGSLLALTPPVVRPLASRVAGRPFRVTWAGSVAAVGTMGVAWTAYSLALVLLVPGAPWHQVVPLGGAFALAYAAGVLVVVAPAGVGAREGLLVALLTPLLGLVGATALALLARLVHTAADAALAVAAWAAARSNRSPSSPSGSSRAVHDAVDEAFSAGAAGPRR